MLDITDTPTGLDLSVADAIVPKAANVLSVQLGALEYAHDFGVDLKYFFDSEIQFQNESFKAYLVERLTRQQVNVASVAETLNALYSKYIFSVGDVVPPVEGLIT